MNLSPLLGIFVLLLAASVFIPDSKIIHNSCSIKKSKEYFDPSHYCLVCVVATSLFSGDWFLFSISVLTKTLTYLEMKGSFPYKKLT